jgi:hypothetical protein
MFLRAGRRPVAVMVPHVELPKRKEFMLCVF